jgi:Ca2+-binding EF-hand superfamily protein
VVLKYKKSQDGEIVVKNLRRILTKRGENGLKHRADITTKY